MLDLGIPVGFWFSWNDPDVIPHSEEIKIWDIFAWPNEFLEVHSFHVV
jgi:hypothetical protein